MLVDIIIVILVLSSLIRNWGSGFLRQFWSVVGFFSGLLLGRILASYTITLAHTSNSRALVTLISILGLALVGLFIGEYIGLRLKHSRVGAKFGYLDNSLGCVLTLVSVLLSVWLAAAVIGDLPATKLKTDISHSKIITALNRILPPAPNVIAELGKLIDPNGFPDVFIGSEPIPRGNVSLPSLGQLAGAVNADKDSVVRIQGYGCGGIVSGSGFVVGNDLVATDAHVVAGIYQPYVEDVSGKHPGRVIWFDPNLDLAILRVTGLAGAPLQLDLNQVAPGTPGAVLGYPGGGAFNAGPAAILDQFEASGRNIYGTGETLRSVYEIQANVIPGNSGGPLITEGGGVMGVVFAQSTTYQHVGYALAMAKIASEINQARDRQQAVSTGQCAE